MKKYASRNVTKSATRVSGLVAVGLSALLLTPAGATAAELDELSNDESTSASDTMKTLSPIADRVNPFGGLGVGEVDPDLSIAGDKAGNAYYATSRAVVKVSPAGAKTAIMMPADNNKSIISFAVAADGTVVVLAQNSAEAKAHILRAKPGQTELKVISREFGRNEIGGYLAINPVDGKLYQGYGDRMGRSDTSVMIDSPNIQVFHRMINTGSEPAPGFSGDGGKARDAKLNGAAGMAFSSNGDLYIADGGNNRIRKVTNFAGEGSNAIITTVGGNGARGYSGDGGVGTDASLNNPTSVSVDAANNVYIADTGNNRVRMLDGYLTVSTVVGSGIRDDLVMGSPALNASLHQPSNVSVTGNGSLIFTSAIEPEGPQSLFISAPLSKMRLTTNPLPADMNADGHSGQMIPRGEAGGRAPMSFDLNKNLELVPSEDGTKFVSGKVEFSSVLYGAPVTITAQSSEFWVTNPIIFSNVLLFHNVTVSHQGSDGKTYESKIDSLSLTYERGYGLSSVLTSPPSPMDWGDMVLPDFKNQTGEIDPDNARLAGAWVMKAGVTMQPEYSNQNPEGSGYAKAVIADKPSFYFPMSDTGTGENVRNLVGSSGVMVKPAIRGVTGPFGTVGSYHFDGGSGSLVRTQLQSDAPNTFAVEAWIKTDTTTGGKIIGFGNSPDGNSREYDRHIYMSDDGRLTFGTVGWPHTTTYQNVQSSQSYNDNKWHHIVGQIGDQGTQLYVDGVLVDENPDYVLPIEQYPDGGYWVIAGDYLGRWPGQPTTDHFTGYVSGAAVYPNTLSAERIKLHANGGAVS